MRILIIYYSFSGNNEKLALLLREKLSADLFKIQESKKRNKFSILFDLLFNRVSKIYDNNTINFDNYEKIILVSPIWGKKIASPMKSFLVKNNNRFKNFHLITVCNGERQQKELIENELQSIIGLKPNSVCELWINNLLPENKRNKVKHTFNFIIKEDDFSFYKNKLDSFCDNVI